MKYTALVGVALWGTSAVLASHAHAQRGGREQIVRERRDAATGDAVTVKVAADAPRPPAEQLKKTQIPQLKDNPAKKEIRALEDLIYSMEKESATVWQYIEDEAGTRKRDVAYVQKQATDLRAKFDAVKAANPGWERLPEYEKRVAHLLRAAAAHQAHYESVDSAREQAANQADAAAEAEWQAKRVADAGPESEFAKAQAGKVAFASKALAAADGSPAVFTSVAVDAPLFGRAYFAESGWNAMHTAGVDCGRAEEKIQRFRYVTYFKVNDGATFELEDVSVDKATFQKARSIELTRHGSLTAGGVYTNDDESRAPFRWISAVAAQLKPGKNAVEIEVHGWCYGATHQGVVLAKSTLTVEASDAGLASLAKRGSFKLTASVHPAGKLGAIRTKLANHFGGKGYDILDFRTASEWAPVRNELTGVILHRAAQGIVLVRKRGTQACELISVVLEEPYDGRKYGPSLDLGGTFYRPFVCNVK